MKLTICFVLFCASYAGATTKRCSIANASLETPSSERILAQGLEMVLAKLEQMDRKLVQLHFELNEHRVEVEQNRASQEKKMTDLQWAINRLDDCVKKDVGRNISLLQDQSLLILAQQSACASHEQFREKWFNFTMKDSEGQGSQEETSISFAKLYKSLMADCDTSTSAPALGESTPAFATMSPTTSPTTASTTTPPPTTTSTTTTPEPQEPSYSSCRNVPSNVSGVFLIRANNSSAPFNVSCEMDKFEGGWLVVQHRFNGFVDFYRNWTQYRDGFGEVDQEFWLGLERIHQLTTARTQELIVEIKDFSGNYGYARYSSFEIGSESKQYELTLGSYNGTAGDGWKNYHYGVKFSTKDQDNDGRSDDHRAVSYEGGWWYGSGGGFSNLNGPFRNVTDMKSIWWHSFTGGKTGVGFPGLSYTRMMIREL